MLLTDASSVFCDFDGTITREDVGVHLISLAREDRVAEIALKMKTGAIGSLEAYRMICDGASISPEAYEAMIVAADTLDPTFAPFAGYLRDRGIPLRVLSDGFTNYIRIIFDRNGFDYSEIPLLANEMEIAPEGAIDLDFPNSNADCDLCGTCKKLALEREAPRRTIFVGDGYSDLLAAKYADFCFAKGTLYEFLTKSETPAFPFDTFDDIRAVFDRRIRGIVFDLDGTLIDSFGAIFESYRHTLSALGEREIVFTDIKHLVGQPLEITMEGFVKKEHVEEAVRIFRAHYGEIFRTMTFPIDPTILAFLRTLKLDHGIKLGIATNKLGVYAREIVEMLGFGEYVDLTLGHRDVPRSKPFPDMIDRIVSEFGLPKEEILYVGDALIDLESGTNAGLPTVLVATGPFAFRELAACKPLITLRHLSELIPMIASQKVAV